MIDQGKRLAAFLGLRFNVEPLFARAWFSNYLLKFAQDIIETTKKDISAIIDLALSEGWSIPQMQDNLETVFRQYITGDADLDQWYAARLPRYRTEMIARTETIRASNAGSVDLYQEWGVKRHEWLATMDDRVRDEHKEAHGQIVEIGTPFMVGGEALMFPGDPEGDPGNTINCRCTTIPIVEGMTE